MHSREKVRGRGESEYFDSLRKTEGTRKNEKGRRAA